MDFQFNLLDEPWIPCARDDLAPPELCSLRDVLAQAASLKGIVESRPTVLIALHRMLLALLHRALQGPKTAQDWQAWWRGGWDHQRLRDYVEKHHDQFDLFDANNPFFQTPGMDANRAVSVSTLAHDRASNVNSPMIFDHQLPGAAITPAEAARLLLGHHAFCTPGLISDDGPTGRASASGSPLMGSLVCLAQGRTLFETLMLNMVQYDPEHELPFLFTDDDAPVWERDPLVGRTEREPAGYADWLTWPSRRILLVPERDAAGATVVRRVVLMDGARTLTGFPIWHRETMVAYRKNAKADADQKQSPYFTIRLNPEKAIWRESHALLSGFDTATKPDEKIGPHVLSVLANMQPDGMRDYRVVPLLVAGVINDQKLVVNWSQDMLAVSPHMLQDRTLVGALDQAVKLAETLGGLLSIREVKLGPKGKVEPSPMKILALEYVRGLGQRAPQSADYSNVAEHLGCRRDYWAALAVPFHRFLERLAVVEDDELGEAANVEPQRQWFDDATTACRKAFTSALESLGETPRAWRARAKAEDQFDKCYALAKQEYTATWGG